MYILEDGMHLISRFAVQQNCHYIKRIIFMMETNGVIITYLTNVKFSFLQSTKSIYCQMFHNYLTISDAYLQTSTGMNYYMKTTNIKIM